MNDQETLCHLRNFKERLRGVLQQANLLSLDNDTYLPVQELAQRVRTTIPGWLDKLTVVSDTLCLKVEKDLNWPKSELLFPLVD